MAENNDQGKKQIVILGGSYGGVSTAHYLLKHAIPKLPAPEGYQVVIVSASEELICRPACPRALISDDLFNQDKLFVHIPKLYEQYPTGSFRFVHGTATKLDHSSRTVTVTTPAGQAESIEFYALVIATGASTPSPLLSLNRDADTLRASWKAFREGLPTAKSIIIAGGGPAGIETAGELGQHLNGQAGWFSSKLADPKVSITVVTAGSTILPVLRPAIAKTAEEYLAKVGVTIIKNARVKTVTPAGAGTADVAAKATVALENGRELTADLYIPATGMRPNTSFVDKALLAPDGRVDANPATLRVDKAGPRVYAVGDVSAAARPAVHLALNAVPVLCANIRRDLLLAAGVEESAAGEDRKYEEGKTETQLVPIGQSSGVGAVMGWRLPSFLIWLIKGRDYWLWTTGSLWSGKQWSKES